MTLALAISVAAIFPDEGISNYGGKFAASPDADAFVKENVDAGKTVFIRFIASEG